jgi:NodT family efflux transporter outer membrane factor (OMF) lipoprotein
VPVEGSAQIERWWATFDDPELSSLVARAVGSNLDLEAATERIRESRASLDIAQARQIPTANFSGSYTRAGTGNTSPKNLWQAGFDAAWEVDIFGGVRRSVESSTASYEASIEDRRAVLVTLLGEVATDYLDIRGLQQEVIIARQNLDTQRHNVDLTHEKQRLGTGTELDIVQAMQQVASTSAVVANLESQEQQLVYALSILLALPPAALDDELRPPREIPAAPTNLQISVPSELLRRRPDIRRSERQLAAATANIGVATAQLFPHFSLTGSAGLAAQHFGGLGNLNNAVWSISPGVSLPVFDPAVWANIKVQNSLQEQALTAYKQTILNALLEVQTALVAYVKEQERRDSLAESVVLGQQALDLAKKRYDQGLTDFLAVLIAEQALLSSQDALVQSNRAVETDVVALYKALGGGWESLEEPATRP